MLLLLTATSLAISQLDLVISSGILEWLMGIAALVDEQYMAIAAALGVSIALARTRLNTRTLSIIAACCIVLGWCLTLLLPGVYPPELPRGGYGLEKAFRDLQHGGRIVGELWPVLALAVLTLLGKEKS